MSVAAVNQVEFGTGIAAVNSTSHLRVYWQAIYAGIRESVYEGAWSGGLTPLANLSATPKLGSGIAATSRGLTNIRVYYISAENKLCEHAYDEGKGWYAGGLNASGFVVAPYSKVAACFLATSDARLRVYVQSTDDTIQEYGYDGAGWQKMTNLGGALPGTHIATTSWTGSAPLSIRTYYQTTNSALIEKAWDGSWYTGGFSVPSAPLRCSIAVTNFNASKSGVSLRVYYAAANNVILEKAYDGSWYDGGFKQSCIPGSKVAAISWGGGGDLQIRVYFQNGTQDSAISEWCWSGGWVAGRAALPPAA